MNKSKIDHPAMITPEEEAELIESSERGEWMSVGNIEERRAYWERLARNTLARLKLEEKGLK